jgi:hypothetical protein
LGRTKITRCAENKYCSLCKGLQGYGRNPYFHLYSSYLHQEILQIIRHPQRRMNLALKDIVKQELQKLLDVGFIYPILDSNIQNWPRPSSKKIHERR